MFSCSGSLASSNLAGVPHRTGKFVAEREEGPSFGTPGGRESARSVRAERASEATSEPNEKVESNHRVEQSKAECQSSAAASVRVTCACVCARARRCPPALRAFSFTLSALFHSRLAYPLATLRCAYHATDRAPLTRDDGGERTRARRAEFRRRQRACVDRSRHRSRESVHRLLLPLSHPLLSRAVFSRVTASLSLSLSPSRARSRISPLRSARLFASSSCTSVAPVGADVVTTPRSTGVRFY